MRIIIDRFEGAQAVAELPDKKTISIPKEILPSGVKEGDVVDLSVNHDETAKRRDRISTLMRDLWKE